MADPKERVVMQPYTIRRFRGEWEAVLKVPMGAGATMAITHRNHDPHSALRGLQAHVQHIAGYAPVKGRRDFQLQAKIILAPHWQHGHVGAIEMPLGGGQGRVQIAAVGSPWDVLKKVVKIARAVATNPAVQSLLPPQVTTAINTADAIAKLTTAQLKQLREHPKATSTEKALATAMLAPGGATPPATAGEDDSDAPETEAPPDAPPDAPDEADSDEQADEEGDDDEQDDDEQDDRPEGATLFDGSGEDDHNVHMAIRAWGKECFAPGSFGEG